MLDLSASIVHGDGNSAIGKKSDGTAANDHDVAFVNAPLYSIFQDILVYFNDKRVCGGDQLYGYKSMLSLLMSYSDTVLKQQMITSWFSKDTAGELDTKYTATDNKNEGHANRAKWNGGKLFIRKLLVDIFQQSKYLHNGVNIKIKLQRAPHEFALMCHTTSIKPRVLIHSASLSVRKVRLSEATLYQHFHYLETWNRRAIYTYDQKVVNLTNLEKGLQKFTEENLFRGHIPKMIVLTMVPTDAYVGSYTRNPYNFQHYKVSSIGLKQNGENTPIQRLEPDFTNGNYQREYLNILSSCSLLGQRSDTLCFDMSEYAKGGYSIFVFNLTPDNSMTSSTSVQHADASNLRLDTKFSSALTENVTLMIMGIFDGVLQIDAERNIYTTGI